MIYINGDSWSRNLWIDWSPEDWCWGKQLSETLEHPIVNEAAGCGSNLRVLDTMTTAYARGDRYLLILIGLTSYARWYLPSKLFSRWNIGPTIIEEKEYRADTTIHKWYVDNCLDDLNLITNYYKTIWQINNFADHNFKCPVMFFNAFDKPMFNFHCEIFGSKDKLTDWCRSHADRLHDFEAKHLLDMMMFFHTESQNWILDLHPWCFLLTDTADIDKAGDRDPGHPSRIGHQKIATYVLSSIKQHLPSVYQSISYPLNQDQV